MTRKYFGSSAMVRQLRQRRIARMVADNSRRVLDPETTEEKFALRPPEEVPGTRAWAEKAGGGKERESA